jgi:hypothetical protein
MMNGRWTEDFSKDLLLELPIYCSGTPDLGLFPGGIGIPRHIIKTIGGAWSVHQTAIAKSRSLSTSEQIGWDDMTVVLKDDFGNNPSHL